MPTDDLNESTVRANHPAVIEPGHTYATITDKISAIVLSPEAPRIWYIGFGLSFILVLLLFYQIARLVAGGLTNRAVAETLFLSEKTIESHLAGAFVKLGVRSRQALAAALDG